MYSVRPIHHNSQMIDACAEILNEEWSRSHTARLHSLKKSNDNYPICLAFVDDETVHVIGHSKICPVVNVPDACFIESVVVTKPLRGRGLGRTLMTLSEEFARGRGFSSVYLTTHDQQKFYEKMGYSPCEPVCSMGAMSNLINDQRYKDFFQSIPSATSTIPSATSAIPSAESAIPSATSAMPSATSAIPTATSAIPSHKRTRENVEQDYICPSSHPLSPPPPPPPPPALTPSLPTPGANSPQSASITMSVSWYKKVLD